MRFAALGVLLLTTPVLGWNDTGHKVVALVAYDRLDGAVKVRVAELLRRIVRRDQRREDGDEHRQREDHQPDHRPAVAEEVVPVLADRRDRRRTGGRRDLRRGFIDDGHGD